MNRLFIAALLASVALAPAYAKDKDKDRLEDRALDQYEDKIERLEDRLQDAGDEERQRIENIIESVTEKYEAKWGELPEVPPPPPPPAEGDALFSDDFERTTETLYFKKWEVNNLGTSNTIENGQLKMVPNGIEKGVAANYVELSDKPTYESFTLSYDLQATVGAKTKFTTLWSHDGANYNILAEYDLADPAFQTKQHFEYTLINDVNPNNPPGDGHGPFEDFYWKFEVTGGPNIGGGAFVDNVSVVGNGPELDSFVGF
jgi:hypothetical protein